MEKIQIDQSRKNPNVRRRKKFSVRKPDLALRYTLAWTISGWVHGYTYFKPNASGRNRIAPTGSVTMMFSMMRRTVTPAAFPARYIAITKKNAPNPMADVNENATT